MDEISQVVELECKGVYYLLNGSKETIALLAKGIMAIADWKHERGLRKAGECSWAKIQEVSNGNPVLLNFPKEMFENSVDNPNVDKMFDGREKISPFELYCEEHGLRYCTMPDLNPDDDYIPVAVPAQDAGIHSEQIKHYMNKKVEREESKDSAYDEAIVEAKEELANAKTDEEKKAAKEKLEALEDGKSQNAAILTESKEQMEKDNVLEFSEYLKMGKGTNFEKDPKQALLQAEMCGMIKEFMPNDCMYPIREEALVPESKEIFYSQKAGENELRTVRRSFKTAENGTVYSTYTVVDPKEPGNVHIFSDKGISQAEWKEQLPELLAEAGMLATTPTTAIRTEERLKAYVDGLDANFSKAPEEEGQEPISNEKAKEMIEKTKEENLQKKSYEDSLYTTVTVPSTAVMADGEQVLSLELANGLVKDIELASMNSEEAQVKIKSDAYYKLERTNGGESLINGEEVLAAIEKNKSHVSTEALKAARSAARK